MAKSGYETIITPSATKYYKLEKLCMWEHAEELNNKLMNGVVPATVSQWCREMGFAISIQKLYEYKGMLKSAIAQSITVEQILGIDSPRVSIQVLEPMYKETKNKVRNELEVLDLLIQRGFDNLGEMGKVITVGDTLRAIELKNKLTQGQHAGLTEFGLEEVRELEDKKFAVILGVIKEYVPEDQWASLDKQIADVEHAYYEEHSPEYLKQYEDAQPDKTV